MGGERLFYLTYDSSRMIKVAPSILSADFSKLGEEIKRLGSAGADWVHVDVMDGNFVPNITIGPGVVKAIRPYTDLPLDVHLMILRPEDYVEKFAEAGADYITIHVEACDRVMETLEMIGSLGRHPGISLNPSTPFKEVTPFMEQLDLLLIMTVNPGFGGQSFMHEVIPKIREAREFVDENELDLEIAIDGGINAETGRLVVEAGATVLDAGSSLFGADDMAAEIERWKRF
jgi:ribulose-phosphate 3-epimerase